MESRLVVTFGVAALAALSGCASGPTMHHSDPSHSEAWNITRAAGYKKLKDVDRADIKQDVDRNKNELIEGAAGGALGFLSNPSGLPLSGNVGLGMLTGLLLGENIPKATWTEVFVWIPKSEAPNRSVAIEHVYEQVTDAFLPLLEQMPMAAPYRLKQVEQLSWAGNGSNDTVHADLAGGECSSEDYFCRISLRVSTPNNVADTFAPSSLGGYPAWRLGVTVSYSFVDNSSFRTTNYARLPLLRVLNELSGALPSNYYVYVAPGDIPFEQSEGEYRFFPAPVVFHEGETLYLIEPKQQS